MPTRAQIKRQGARCIFSKRISSEVSRQLWLLPDKRLYRGDDWYNDVDARVHLLHYPLQVIEIISLATQLPTGLVDPKAIEKYHREKGELTDALINEDLLGAIMEAGDCAYYAIKAEVNGLITPSFRDTSIEFAATAVSLPVKVLFDCVIAKMSLRARPGNPKDDKAEREAVMRVLAEVARL